MKVREGFVSNSSSSSFIATGFKVSEDKLNDRVKELIEQGDLSFFNGLLVDDFLASGIDDDEPTMLAPEKLTASMVKMSGIAAELGVEATVGICYGNYDC